MKIDLRKSLPYAKAIFALAVRDNQLEKWQDILNTLALVVIEYKKFFPFDKYRIAQDHEFETLCEIAEKIPHVFNLVRVLNERKKINMLPSIAASYKDLFFSYIKKVDVKVITAEELSHEQKLRLISSLENRYKCKVLLQIKLDRSLIGGIIVYILGNVIDGSVKGMLLNLKRSLYEQVLC